MSNIVDIYTDAVYDNLKPLRANWDPHQPVALGDIGTLSGEVFQHIGNVNALGLAIGATLDDNTGDQRNFSSSSDVSVSFTAAGGATAGSAVAAKASVSITFGSSNTAYFNAAGCSYSMIADKIGLANKIMALYDADKWQREWVVVTDLVKAASATIIISGADSANILLEANGNVPNINLADANLGLTVKSSSKIGYQIVAERGLTPLIGLSKIQPWFLWMGPEFKPLTASVMSDAGLARAKMDSPFIQSEPREYLQFSQMT